MAQGERTKTKAIRERESHRPALLPQAHRVALVFMQTVVLIMISLVLGQSIGGEYNSNSSILVLPPPPPLKENATTSTRDMNVELKTNAPPPPKNSLEIAWLMSFPNSGTSYTLHLVKAVSQTQTATNYAKMRAAKKVRHGGNDPTESIPVFDNQPTGPFWSDPLTNESIENNSTTSATVDKPTAFVLTKTHCGAPCEWCPPEKYAQMLHHFRLRCARTESIILEAQEDGTVKRNIQKGIYSFEKVTKNVHVIRDPFDNVVSRFNYERSNGRTATEYPATAEGFREYCSKLNEEFREEHRKGRFIDRDILKQLESVPCYADFLRYVEWHNMAFITARDLGLDTHVLHYEGYSTRFNETTAALLEFLHLPERGDPPHFVPFKTYRSSYFTMEEQAIVRFALEQTALKETWAHLKRQYFRPPA